MKNKCRGFNVLVEWVKLYPTFLQSVFCAYIFLNTVCFFFYKFKIYVLHNIYTPICEAVFSLVIFEFSFLSPDFSPLYIRDHRCGSEVTMFMGESNSKQTTKIHIKACRAYKSLDELYTSCIAYWYYDSQFYSIVLYCFLLTAIMHTVVDYLLIPCFVYNLFLVYSHDFKVHSNSGFFFCGKAIE